MHMPLANVHVPDRHMLMLHTCHRRGAMSLAAATDSMRSACAAADLRAGWDGVIWGGMGEMGWDGMGWGWGWDGMGLGWGWDGVGMGLGWAGWEIAHSIASLCEDATRAGTSCLEDCRCHSTHE